MKKSPGFVALVLCGSVVLAGCDGLFEVDNPTNIVDEELDDPLYADALANSAAGALSLIYDNAIRYGDMVADGIMHVSNRRGNVQLDQGDVEIFNNRVDGVWDELSVARYTATEARTRLEDLVEDPAGDMRLARVYFWDAVARITLADYFHEIPLDGGEPNPPAVIYEQAIDLLSDAAQIAAAAGNLDYEAGAYAAIARAYRSLYYDLDGSDPDLMASAGDFAEQALEVKPDFEVVLVYAPPGTSNSLFDGLRASGYYDVMEDTWARTTDPVSGEPEPRIQHGDPIGLSAYGDSVYPQEKYTGRDAPIPVTRWQEAKLIVAERELLLGSTPDAVDAINDVRAAAGLAEFDSSDEGAILDQLIYERAVEFWLEGRRWQDMRYYDIDPPRWSDDATAKGIDRRWPVSLQEKGSNPNY